MAKIGSYSALTAAQVAVGDLFWITDVSAGTAGTKSITAAQVAAYVLTSPTITGTAGIGGAPVLGRGLRVYGTSVLPSAATAYGIESVVTFNSDTTSVGVGVRAQVATVAASFTMASAIGVLVADPSKGAGSTITSSTGVLVVGQSAGGVDNYGINVLAPSGGSGQNTAIAATPGDRGLLITGIAAGAATTKQGVTSSATFNSSTTAAAHAVHAEIVLDAASFTVTEAAGVRVANASKGAGSAITSLYGILVNSQTGGGTNNYGILVSAPSGASGSNTAVFAVPGDRGVQVGGAAAGAATTKYGVLSNAAFNASTTVSAYAGYFQLATAAASFTLTNGAGVLIETPSKGADSAITNVYGIKINAQTGGATLNYAWHAATTTNASHLTQAGVLTIGSDIVSTAGSVSAAAAGTLGISARALFGASADGVVRVTNAAGTGLTRFILGAGTTSFAAFSVSGPQVSLTLGDGTAGGTLGVGVAASVTAALTLPASVAGVASFRMPHGTAPSSPVDGDRWDTTAGAFARINGVTYNYAGGGATASGEVITAIEVVDGRVMSITVGP